MIYDLIVVGGSAIGLYLAKNFALLGKRVLILEKKSKIGEKVCSGLVSSHIFDYFPKEDIFSICEKNINGANIWVDKKKFFFKGKALVLDRQKLDEYLAREARKAKVELLLSKRVNNIVEREGFVEISCTDREIFRSKLVAGCDGAVSFTAHKIGLADPKKKYLLGIIFLQKTDPGKDNFVELFFNKTAKSYFGWRIPRGDCIEWGVALESKRSPKQALTNILKENNIVLDETQIKASLIPNFPLKKTHTKRIFLCGDAAGQIKPYTGGGLIYGFHCAKVAVKNIQNFDNPDLSVYEKEWRKDLMKQIYFGNFLRKCYLLPDFIKKIALSILKLKKGIDQDRPLSIFKV
jgi:geranylgeranyl reductase family protein